MCVWLAGAVSDVSKASEKDGTYTCVYIPPKYFAFIPTIHYHAILCLRERIFSAEPYAAILSLVANEDKFSETQQNKMFTMVYNYELSLSYILINCLCVSLNSLCVHGVWCHWWFHYPGLLLHTELMVSLFIRCTVRCEIWAQPAELPR